LFRRGGGGTKKTHRRIRRWVANQSGKNQPSIAKAGMTALRHVACGGVEFILAMTGFIGFGRTLTHNRRRSMDCFES
jgi:hypothetical protein